MEFLGSTREHGRIQRPRSAFPLKHDRVLSGGLPYPLSMRLHKRRAPMTVCIAAMFNWNYAPVAAVPEWGKVIITASDRQITAGDVEYEPPQFKVGFLGRNVLLLIAGDYAIHSEALLHAQRRLISVPEADPGVIAELYASFVRGIKHRHAANIYLSPV